MAEQKIEYTMREESTVEVKGLDPIDLQSIPVWSVTRVSGGMGWHIAKYKTPEAAKTAKGVLEALREYEVL